MRLSKVDMFLPEPPPPGGRRRRALARTRGHVSAVFPGPSGWGRGQGASPPPQLVATLDGEGPEGREAWQVHLRLLGRPRGLSFSENGVFIF